MSTDPLTRKQRLAVVELLNPGTLDEVANRISISPSTLDNWLADPVFRGELNAALDRVFETAINRAATQLTQTIEFWVTLRDNEDAANRDRLKASENLADVAWKRRDLRLDDRIAALEQANEQRNATA